jgi:hypothetical protein
MLAHASRAGAGCRATPSAMQRSAAQRNGNLYEGVCQMYSSSPIDDYNCFYQTSLDDCKNGIIKSF